VEVGFATVGVLGVASLGFGSFPEGGKIFFPYKKHYPIV
jgi:hypothetical protein